MGAPRPLRLPSVARRCLLAVAVLTSVVAAPLSADVAGAQTAAVDWGDLDTSGLVDLGAPPTDPGPLTFLLGLDVDRAGIESTARSVSDPTSSRYGSRTSVADLADRFGASAATTDAVVGYFADTFGVAATIDPTGTYATVVLSLSQAQTAFGTTWHVFGYPPSSVWNGVDYLAPTSQPTLPAALAGAVVAVDGALVVDEGAESGDDEITTIPSGPVAGGTAFRTGVAEGCAEIEPGPQPADSVMGLAPNQLRTAYQLDELHDRGLRGQGMRVAVIDESSYDAAWLAEYRSCFGLSDATEVVDHVIGTPDQSVDGMTETILDLSVLSFAAPEVERIDSFMVDTTANDELDDGIAGMVQMFSVPLDASQTGGEHPDVISASFGICEASDLFWATRSAAVAILETVLATAAAAGITYVVASGDSGSSGCLHNLGIEAPETAELSASYPSTSKWVTAVGGTNLTLGPDNSLVSSGVWNDLQFGIGFDEQGGAGGGGTSSLVGRPWYQDVAAVPGDRSARVVPDVAMFADELPGYLLFAPSSPATPGGPAGPATWTMVGGTSAATPLFAGIALLIGQEARQHSQPTLGFANPLLYELGATGSSSLLDILLGSNNMAPAWVDCCDATPGFDLATGWGTPMAQRLSDALAAPAVTVAGTGSTDGSLQATFVAAVSPPAGRVLSYEWDLDGDGRIDRTTTEPTLTVTAPAAGTETVAVVVRTSLGRAGMGVGAATVVRTVPRSLAFAG